MIFSALPYFGPRRPSTSFLLASIHIDVDGELCGFCFPPIPFLHLIYDTPNPIALGSSAEPLADVPTFMVPGKNF